MKIPFVDLKAQHRSLEPELSQTVARVLENVSFVLGPEVKAFEEAFASYVGASHCVAMNSGTAALHLTMLGYGIGSGHEVITVPHTFMATAASVSAAGARPVFVDVHPRSYTMDPARVEAAITRATRAILPVHLYGQPVDMDPLLEIARRHNLLVIEDACQAHGALYKGRMAGSLGDAACFSFYPSKNLGACGEGGAVVTNDAQLAEKLRLLRDHGSVRKYEHRFPAYNLRMEGMQGAVLNLKLKHLDRWNENRRSRAALYNRLLEASGLILPAEMEYARHVYHLYVVQANDRDGLREHLSRNGIESGLHYPIPLHLQEAYRGLGHSEGDFPVSEHVAKCGLSLPMYAEMSDEAVERVAAAVAEWSQCPIPETLKKAN